jgi:hypothetical protein
VTEHYLGIVDVCKAAGYDWRRVSNWVKSSENFPEPDVTVSRSTTSYRGWSPERLPELVKWIQDYDAELRLRNPTAAAAYDRKRVSDDSSSDPTELAQGHGSSCPCGFS